MAIIQTDWTKNKPVGDWISAPSPNFVAMATRYMPHNILHGSIEAFMCVGISAPAPRPVAFFVGLSDNVGPIKSQTQTPVVFDRVVTNIGNAYDPVTGRFTAPINGTYQFNVVVSAQGRHKVIHASFETNIWHIEILIANFIFSF